YRWRPHRSGNDIPERHIPNAPCRDRYDPHSSGTRRCREVRHAPDDAGQARLAAGHETDNRGSCARTRWVNGRVGPGGHGGRTPSPSQIYGSTWPYGREGLISLGRNRPSSSYVKLRYFDDPCLFLSNIPHSMVFSLTA